MDRADIDPQREDELSEQRGYGETPESSVTASIGLRQGTQPKDGEHGFLRDDGQKDRPQTSPVAVETAAERVQQIDEGNNPVLMPRDGRAPNMPETLNADIEDKGIAPDHEAVITPAPTTQELEDAYSQNDPGVKTKD